jgi:hypothetical protein
MTEEIDPEDIVDPATLAVLDAATKFAKSLVDDKCVRCVDFTKALAHTKCICEPMMELIVARAPTGSEREGIIAAWMTIQKVNREGK